MTEPEALVSSLRKRRGVAKGSITRLVGRVSALERDPTAPNVERLAKQLQTRLEEASSLFRQCHMSLVDAIDDESILESEQTTLDQVYDTVEELAIRLQTLIDLTDVSKQSNEHKILSKRLARVQRDLEAVHTFISSFTDRKVDIPHLKQYGEQLQDCKKELADICLKLLSLDLEDTDELFVKHIQLESILFDYAIRIKEMETTTTLHSVTPTSDNSKGIKLPKLEVPTFNGNILNWKSFWEQFSIAVHEHTNLSNSEKLVYLQQALKGGAAKATVEGLSRTGDNYNEAIRCLKARFDRPRMIHQAHVKSILDTPSLKDGSGKEIRKFHDNVLQHVRALVSMGYEPSGPFLTSTLELKLDQSTMFEWQKHSLKSESMPHYLDLLEFLNMRAQATESIVVDNSSKRERFDSNTKKGFIPTRSVSSNVSGTDNTTAQCVLCKPDKHALYACPRFKSMSHESKMSTVRSNGLCMNCLGSNHFVKYCKSVHRCKRCQKQHHTLLHVDGMPTSSTLTTVTPQQMNPSATPFTPKNMTAPDVSSNKHDLVSSNTAIQLKSDSLLMTCRVLVCAPHGACIEATALLDNASSASFVSQRLAQTLRLPRASQNLKISGVAGLNHRSSSQSITSFCISPLNNPQQKIVVSAVVVPKVTCDLPFSPVTLKQEWSHLHNLELADPGFGCPGTIDLLLGIDVYVDVIRHGRRQGQPGTPIAFETCFGWVLAGSTKELNPNTQIASHHVSCDTSDQLLRKFWDLEDGHLLESNLTSEEYSAVQYFKSTYARNENGMFIVPLPKRESTGPLGESRPMAVRRFLSLERNLHSKNQFDEFNDVMNEYFKLGHAESVPSEDLNKDASQTFYMPMHAVRKESSSTTKIRAVFDASMKTTTGLSLNDILMVGPTVHSSLVEVLIRFRLHRIALVADISKMYRAIELLPTDRDYHRFVWRSHPDDRLHDYRMTRVTFGVSSSAFIANMAVKQNAIDYSQEFPLAAKAVDEAFYVDDCLTGADSIEEAIELQTQLQNLFAKGNFLLRKWNSSSHTVLQSIPTELQDSQSCLTISNHETAYTKTLGIEWHSMLDHFRFTFTKQTNQGHLTKRALVSDIAKIYDVLGWFAPVVVKAKIMLQRVWESKVDWDEEIPDLILQDWSLWRSQLNSLSEIHIPRCYFPIEVSIVSTQLHGFSDASENAYAAVLYLRLTDNSGNIHISLVTSKTKVAPIKRLTIPRLELCGAHLLTKLLDHTRKIFKIPIENIQAWTDSTIVLSWLNGNGGRLRAYVGNRVSFILERIPVSKWRHIPGESNPADCASRGLFPQELVNHPLWWKGPSWLTSTPSNWPTQPLELPSDTLQEEFAEICHHTHIAPGEPLFPLNRFSSYSKMINVTAWIFRFLNNCRVSNAKTSLPLTTQENLQAEKYWLSYSQRDCFSKDIESLKNRSTISRTSTLLSLNPFIDSDDILRVGGREQNSKLAYSAMHPVILSGRHSLTKLIIRSEHLRLLHAGPTLVYSSLSRRYHIVGGRKAIRSITRSCVICLRQSERPRTQKMGQLPMERVTPDIVFENVGIDYAGPIYIKYGYVRKPTVIKSYICLFVSLSVKAVHLELVLDLTTDAFIAALRRFIARRGKPKLIWSDHGTNFVGANNDLKELAHFLSQQKSKNLISKFCTTQSIDWKFIPERAPHFGGLWESAVKSAKYHLRRIMANVKLTFEECCTVLTQIEAILNSRPLVSTPNDDGIDMLTPGHFLIGKPIEALPDPSFSHRSISLLRRWHLCQNIIQQFWQRWSQEYLSSLRSQTKWYRHTRNFSIGDIVILCEDNITPTKWPLGKVTRVFTGSDNLVRVVELKTQHGTYRRPIRKIALLLPATTEQ